MLQAVEDWQSTAAYWRARQQTYVTMEGAKPLRPRQPATAASADSIHPLTVACLNRLRVQW